MAILRLHLLVTLTLRDAVFMRSEASETKTQITPRFPIFARSITSSSTSVSGVCFPLAFLPPFALVLTLALPLFASFVPSSLSSSSPNKNPLPFILLFSSDENVECAVPDAKFDDAESSPSIQEKFEEVRCGRDLGERVEAILDGGDSARAGGDVGRELRGEGSFDMVVKGAAG